MTKKPSLYPTDNGCFICHSPYTETHHIYPGNGRRLISDREGCTIQLCHAHHNGSAFGVHFDKKLDQWLRMDCERRWCAANNATAEDFRKVFGTSYT